MTVTVTNREWQSGSLASGFTYVVVPTVTSVSPNNGPTAGGTAVTITGTNFAAGATVTFGGTAATNVVVVNSTTITATTPAGQCGCGDGDGDGERTEREPGQWIYLHCSADGEQCVAEQRATAGGTAVTITGTNFAAGATVTFGGSSGDERGGGEQHTDHGHDAGGQRGRGDGDGDQRARRAGV